HNGKRQQHGNNFSFKLEDTVAYATNEIDFTGEENVMACLTLQWNHSDVSRSSSKAQAVLDSATNMACTPVLPEPARPVRNESL
ncbi:hypothetical protein EK904_002399, partial [Melospiza melodia maxima]